MSAGLKGTRGTVLIVPFDEHVLLCHDSEHRIRHPPLSKPLMPCLFKPSCTLPLLVPGTHG